MKKEINPRVFFAILAAVVAFIGWLMWTNMESPENRPGYERENFREVEKWAKAHNYDLKKNGLTALVYYKFHPEEKPPANVPAPTPKPQSAPPAK